MAYNEKYGGGIPPVPSSLNTATPWQNVNLHNDPEKDDQLRPHPDTDPEVTPYLGMRARLSQLWFNRWTILLLLVLIRVILLTGSLNENLGDAKVKALSACTKVEDVGSAMASMPHYMSKGVNALAASSMQKAIKAMASLLKMILTAVQSIIIFVLNMYIGTFTCLVAAFIHGGLHVASKVVEGGTEVINKAIGAITNGLAQDVKKFQDMINDAKDFVNTGGGFFTGGKDIIKLPDINIENRLKDLKGIKIDATNVIKGIDTLDKKIPTFDQAKKMAESAIAIPFNMVKQEIDTAFDRFNVSQDTFPVAEKQALSFCSDNSFLTDFFESLFSIVHKGKIAFFVVIIILAVLAMVIMGFLEYHRWQREKNHAQDIAENSVNNQDSIYIASRRWTATAGFKIANFFSPREKGKKWLLIRWAVAYATSLPALFVLSLAIAGFFSCFCQWVILRQIEAKAPELATQVGDFAGDVVGTLKQVSDNWANSSNTVIIKMENDINKDVFGWINEAVKSVNDTLTTVENELDHALIKVFDKTVLLDTARDVVACLIGNKIDAIQDGLTWLHNHTKVELPKFDNDIFSSGAAQNMGGDNDMNSFLAKPGAVTTDEINEAVGKVIRSLRNGIIQEALISLGLLLLYIIVVLIGVMGALIGMATPTKNRGDGGGPGGFRPTSSFHNHNGFDPALAPSNAMVNNPASPHYQPNEKYGDNLHPGDANRSNGNGVNDMYGEASPAYEEVVYAGRVPAGKTRELITRYPSHQRTSSYPTVERDGPNGYPEDQKVPGYFTPV
ncbi:plasma membrane fusion protein prm-1 [Sordaria brevicollis]|uniref:Plasma membrane fusion protein PRM1 n=1 Tax=Sordaria brevicollis TaxID=83679 RepID=A0AAE0PBH7_SORBR|nr:plasma membrane fusion protein prm-1 [Sordaria brevicollis]